MNRIVKTFIKAFETAKVKKWDKIYVGVDIHETCLKPTWSTTLSSEYYEYAKEALQLMTENEMVCLILWSCSLPDLNKQYCDNFTAHDIKFDYINENPECPSTHYANFDLKLYFSVGLDDKFGFIPEEDWQHVYEFFYKQKLLKDYEVLPFKELGENNPIIECNYLQEFTEEVIKELEELKIPNFKIEKNNVYANYEKNSVKGMIITSDKGEYCILYGEGTFHTYSSDTLFYKTKDINGIKELFKMKTLL